MRKYNRSDIMKKAWAVYRNMKKWGWDFSKCLKNAWAETKAVVEHNRAKKSKFFGTTADIHFEGRDYTVSLWEKYGKRRAYCGNAFVDLTNGKIFGNGKNEIAALNEFCWVYNF